MNSVDRDLVLPAAPEDVWEALTDPERLGEWFGADVSGELQTGEVTAFRMPDGTERRALVETVDPPRRLVFRWLPYERDASGELRERETSRVEIDCVPVSDGTRLRVVETRVEAAVTPIPRIGFRPLARVV